MDKISLDVTTDAIEAYKAQLRGLIRNTISEAGYIATDAGRLSQLMSDLRALDFVEPTTTKKTGKAAA